MLAFRKIATELTVSNNGLILKGTKVIIPNELRTRVINLAHEGHQGQVKTKTLLREKVWFPNIDSMVASLCDSCIPCLSTYDAKPPEPLKMTQLPDSKWSHLAADFYGPLPSGEHLLVVIDEYSRFPEVEIIRSLAAKTVIPALTKNKISGGSYWTMSRHIVKRVLSVEQAEGMGARVRRSVGRPELRNLDPFLLLDEGRVKKPAGFPDHPHRGFETVMAFVLTSTLLSFDFIFKEFFICHHSSLVGLFTFTCYLQWMTAGRGIVHSEMPGSDEENHVLQLWVNLSKEFKMVEPHYQELLSKDIPVATRDGVTVKVIAGESLGKKSQVRTRTPTTYLDFKIAKGGEVSQALPRGWTAFAYVLTGKAWFGEGEQSQVGEAHHTLVLSDGDHITINNKDETDCHFVLIAGRPIGEPIKQHGPFVMNTNEEIQQAIDDYRNARNGFEKVLNWKSKAGGRF
ncbi:pirin-like [Anneissia japonica]|uniref:pirin-like n=1 Tax=Anneissia japonica TaxID=1529436 RepID=UPI0014258353|nr:pirin-like [Anneissia japonica]